MPRETSRDIGHYTPFFKIINFHYHLNDNSPLNGGQNDTWQGVRSHFPQLPEDNRYSSLVIVVTVRPCHAQIVFACIGTARLGICLSFQD